MEYSKMSWKKTMLYHFHMVAQLFKEIVYTLLFTIIRGHSEARNI